MKELVLSYHVSPRVQPQAVSPFTLLDILVTRSCFSIQLISLSFLIGGLRLLVFKVSVEQSLQHHTILLAKVLVGRLAASSSSSR